ncbi:MAG: hypothetical protein JWO88_1263 [Frankiales bacterium]|nr:hypothetical protein [Frankiales bacterium]
MTDLQTLLLDAGQPGAEPSANVVDEDLARGRRALAHRRLRRGGTRTVLAAAAAVGALFVVQAQGVSPSPAHTATGPAGTSSIKLVAYTGTQPAGYTVDAVPAGWEIQGVNNYVLTIAAAGNPDRLVDSFAGKLVVMLLSKDASIPTTGSRVAVGSSSGVVSHFDPSTAQLFFTDAAGHVLDIQVPAALRWTDAQIGQFGAAVHVNASAQAGVG